MYSLEQTPLEVRQALAQKHKLLRKKLRLSQVELAERSGVSLGSLKRFESTGKISLESLLKLAHLIGRLEDFDHVFQAGADMDKVERLFTSE